MNGCADYGFRTSPNAAYFARGAGSVNGSNPRVGLGAVDDGDQSASHADEIADYGRYLATHSVEDTFDRLALPNSGSESSNAGLGLLSAAAGERSSYQTLGAASSIISLYGGGTSPNPNQTPSPQPSEQQQASPSVGSSYSPTLPSQAHDFYEQPLTRSTYSGRNANAVGIGLPANPRLARAPSGPRPLSQTSDIPGRRRPSNASSIHGPSFGPRSPSFGANTSIIEQDESRRTLQQEPARRSPSGARILAEHAPQQHSYQQPSKRPLNIPPLPKEYAQVSHASQKAQIQPLNNDQVYWNAGNSTVEVNGSHANPAVIASPPLETSFRNATLSESPAMSRYNSVNSQKTLPSPKLSQSHGLKSSHNTFYPPEKGGASLSPNSSFTASQSQQQLRRNASYASLPYNPFGTPTGQSADEDFYGDFLAQHHFDQALVSNLAIYLKDNVPRAEHTRGAIPYPYSFTGSDLVNTIERSLSDQHKSRAVALHAARSLHSQLFFFEVRDNTKAVHDGLDQVFVFADAEDPFDDGGGGGSPNRLFAYEDLPTGVVTELTNCYSPLCARLTAQGIGGGTCVSPSCPNNLHSVGLLTLERDRCLTLLDKVLLKRQLSQASEAPSQPIEENLPWALTVDKDILDILDKQEVERQNRIHELINGEIAYVKDIDILRTEFLEPIVDSEPPIIHPDLQPDFFEDILFNAFEVRQVAQNFSDALLDRQREEAPVIQRIGDVIYASALDWSGPYVQYARHHKLAEARIKKERARNPLLDQFLNSFHRRPATRKLDITNFMMFIVQRLQRYKLLAQAILSKTADDNSDKEALEQAIELIDKICRDSDFAVADTAAVIECRNLHAAIIAPQSSLNDLELQNEGRKVLMRSRMYRRPESSGLAEWTALHVILFDNYLVITKQRGKGSDVRFSLAKRPIPLQLLTATGFDEPPQPKSNRILLRSLKATESSAANAGTAADADDRMLYPITFNATGRQGGIFILFAESQSARNKWRALLAKAASDRESVLAEQQVFSLQVLSTDTFKSRGRIPDYSRSSTSTESGFRSGTSGGLPFGRPTCSASFTTPENHKLVAIGHEEGLWIGLRKDPTSCRLVLHLKAITQCAVLQDFGLLLVLANRQLIAYPLDALVPSAASSKWEAKEPQKLSGKQDVLFFKVGKVGPRTLIIYAKKDGVTQTVFKALEPIAKEDQGPRGFIRKKTEWFREYREFFIPSAIFGLLFMRSQLSIICEKGFELIAIDKEPLRSISFPDWSKLKSDAKAAELQKRCNDSRAVGMYRLTDTEFLFAFEDLAFYADKHGDPIKERYGDIIDWQGTARSVAHIAPYILAFDSNFIEVRHALSGRLVQIIKAREVLCTNDGQDPPATRNADRSEVDRQVQVALRAYGGSTKDCYHVAELVMSAQPNMKQYFS